MSFENSFMTEYQAQQGFLKNIGTAIKEVDALVFDGFFKILENFDKIEKQHKVERTEDLLRIEHQEKETKLYQNKSLLEFKQIKNYLRLIHEGQFEKSKTKEQIPTSRSMVENVHKSTKQRNGLFFGIDTRGMKDLGVGMVALAGGVGAMGLAFGLISLRDSAEMVVAAGAVGLTVYGFHKLSEIVNDKEITKLSGSMALLGLGVGAMGLSLAGISALDYDIEKILIVGTSMTVLGLGLALISNLGTSTMIQGAAGIGIMSLAMYGFAWALNESSNLIGTQGWGDMLENVGKIATSMALIGGTMALLGFGGAGTVLIGAGAIGVALMGGAMWVFAKGLADIQKLNLNDATAENIGNAIGEIFDAVADSAGILTGLKIVEVSGAMAVLGGGLKALSYGVDSYMTIDRKYGNVSYEKIGTNIRILLNTVKDVFTEIGQDTRMSPMKFFLGTDFGSTPMERGISSVRDLGTLMTTLADGVASWANMGKKYPGLKVDTISERVSEILTLFEGVFTKIGQEKTNSPMQFFFGDDFGETPVERGIASVRDLGTVLVNLADGIVSWANIDKKYPGLKVDAIATNITTILNLTKDVFAEIGKDTKTSVLKLLTGNDFGETPVERGIASVRDLGTVMTTLADGVLKWSNIDTLTDKDGNPVKFDPVGIRTKISSLLTILPSIFEEIGEKYDSSWWESNTDLESGLKGSKEIGEVISVIGDSLANFDRVDNPIEKMNKLASTYERIATASKTINRNNLTKLNELFFNHYQIIKTDIDDNKLAQLIERITELINKLGKQTVTTQDKKKAEKTTIVQSAKTDDIINELKLLLGNDSLVNANLKKIAKVLNTGTIKVKTAPSI